MVGVRPSGVAEPQKRGREAGGGAALGVVEPEKRGVDCLLRFYAIETSRPDGAARHTAEKSIEYPDLRKRDCGSKPRNRPPLSKLSGCGGTCSRGALETCRPSCGMSPPAVARFSGLAESQKRAGRAQKEARSPSAVAALSKLFRTFARWHNIFARWHNKIEIEKRSKKATPQNRRLRRPNGKNSASPTTRNGWRGWCCFSSRCSRCGPA